MTKDLEKSIIFLHGLSGSGKGELQRQITEKYTSNGYEVIYGSSGDLLRAGFSDPFIRTRLLSGYYFETLEPIIPGLKSIFKNFLKEWHEKDGRVALILDGVIRRTDFIGSEGNPIPSQIEQVSRCLNDTIKELIDEDPSLLKDFPEYANSEDDELRVSRVERSLKNANHLITDVRPQDAEAQMKSRAVKEVKTIKEQLADLIRQGDIPESKREDIVAQTLRIEDIVNADSTQELKGKEVQGGETSTIDLNIALNEVKNELARTVGVEGESTTLASIYGSLGVTTSIREDDITPLGRSNRVGNFAKRREEDGRTVYEPGFAALALAKDLGFTLTPSITFESTTPNCHVVENGQSRGVSLDEFRAKSRLLAGELFVQGERERTLHREGIEGIRRGKER